MADSASRNPTRADFQFNYCSQFIQFTDDLSLYHLSRLDDLKDLKDLMMVDEDFLIS